MPLKEEKKNMIFQILFFLRFSFHSEKKCLDWKKKSENNFLRKMKIQK